MAGEASGTLLAVSGFWSLEQCHSAWKSKRTGSVSRGFPSGSKTPRYTISTREASRGGKAGRCAFGRRAVAIHKEFQCLVMHLNQFACRTTNKTGTGRRAMQTKRYWLDYDPVALAVLVIGIGAIELLALSI
jgi:hypothetical protein